MRSSERSPGAARRNSLRSSFIAAFTVDVPTAVVVTTLHELVPEARQRKLARSIPGAEVFEVEGDHDACMREAAFPPTLVRACLSVARRAGLLAGSPRTAGADPR
jgi:hypothetical protein